LDGKPWERGRKGGRNTGKQRDYESNLDFFNARYFGGGNNLGRFMTPDPLPWLEWQHGNKEEREKFEDFLSNPQNFNMYVYVLNNPLSKTDPSGMKGCQAGDKKFAGGAYIAVYVCVLSPMLRLPSGVSGRCCDGPNQSSRVLD
jgi:RHS repeat-associated protein